MKKKIFKSAVVRALLVCAALFVSEQAGAQQLFKCGGTYQDRPCASQDVQQRYSRLSGDFSVSQVNPDTDKDCANATTAILPYWERMNKGESVDALRAEIEARPISRYEKSRMRDVFLSLKQFNGKPSEVRSELERTCMNYKKAHGIPTERDQERAGEAQLSRSTSNEAHSIRAQARAAEARAAAEDNALRFEQMRARAAAQAASRAAAAERQSGNQR